MHTLRDWLAYIERQHPKNIEMGLERVHEVHVRMALQKPAAHVVTVGGTNGKGSTVAFVESIARSAGLRVGAYTSPHLLRYNERVRIDRDEASDGDLLAAFEAVEAARGATPLTYFEFGTLAALWLFQRAGLDLAVLEVGLGGRLDAVNVVDPDVAVITTVDIDHVEWLGPDRESIGFEKAGIARPWKPLVLGEVDSPASVLRHAYAIGANAIRLGSDYFHESIDAERWRWREVGMEMTLPTPVLAAPAQRSNAAAAIAALRALPLEITPEAFERGVAAASLPGRLQRFDLDGVRMVLDVAHNPQAARELAAWLRSTPSSARTLAVFAVLADKDVRGIVNALSEHVSRWLLAGLESAGGRGQTVDALASKLQDTAAAHGAHHATVADALRAARAAALHGDRILVFGSFHTVAQALVLLHSGA
ncbi:MAG TPA: bifunctional tetrahydrofolate synthase/dihydrofolate synthase [Pseudoxanthomonas sp.]|nr:bifunctional tetrahydrofolate synthase/dihydrofolate synthase [Pseudoxanthomonas sp.]